MDCDADCDDNRSCVCSSRVHVRVAATRHERDRFSRQDDCFKLVLEFLESVDEFEFEFVHVAMVDGLVLVLVLIFVIFELACGGCNDVVDDFVVAMEDDCVCFLVFWSGFDFDWVNPFVLLLGVLDLDLVVVVVVVAVAFVVVVVEAVRMLTLVVGGVAQRSSSRCGATVDTKDPPFSVFVFVSVFVTV